MEKFMRFVVLCLLQMIFIIAGKYLMMKAGVTDPAYAFNAGYVTGVLFATFYMIFSIRRK